MCGLILKEFREIVKHVVESQTGPIIPGNSTRIREVEVKLALGQKVPIPTQNNSSLLIARKCAAKTTKKTAA